MAQLLDDKAQVRILSGYTNVPTESCLYYTKLSNTTPAHTLAHKHTHTHAVPHVSSFSLSNINYAPSGLHQYSLI